VVLQQSAKAPLTLIRDLPRSDLGGFCGCLSLWICLDFRLLSNQFSFFELASEMFPDLSRIEIQERTTGGEVLQKHLTNRISKRSRRTGHGDEPAHSSEDRNGFE
jgi:hypothetical protein